MNFLQEYRGRETVLLIEDDIFCRELFIECLAPLGYEIIVAEDGQEGVDKYKENIGKIDIVVTDIVMPCKDGIEVYNEVTKINPESLVLLMSSDTPDNFSGINADIFMSKPLKPYEFVKRIRYALDNKNVSVS